MQQVGMVLPSLPAAARARLDLALYARAVGARALAEALEAESLAQGADRQALVAHRQAREAVGLDAVGLEAVLAAQGFEALNAAIQVAAQVRGAGAHDRALVLSGIATRLATRDAWRWLDYAADLLALGRAAEAATAYREVLAFDPENMFALLGVLRVARESGDHEAALAASLAAAEVAPRDAWRWMDVAQELNALGRPLEAEDAYRTILGLDPTNAEALLALGHSARTRGDHGAALCAYAAAAVLLPRDTWRWHDVALELSALGQDEAAEEAFARILAIDPNHLPGLLGTARCARRRGAHEAALAAFSRAAELAPGDKWRWTEMGEELSELGRLEEAEAAFRRAIEAAPGDAHAVLRLAAFIRTSGGSGAEQAFYEEYAATHPEVLWARLRVATGLRVRERLDEAEAICREVLAKEPENVSALLESGQCARQKRDHVGALALFRKAVALAPDDLWPRLELAQELRAAGDSGTALVEAEEIARRYPGERAALIVYAQCLRDAGRHEEALTAYEQAAAAFPDDNGVLVELAAQKRRLGRHGEAEEHLAQVLARDPLNTEAIADLGRTALLLGDFAKAYQLYSSAAEEKPDDFVFQMGVIDTLAAVGELDQAILRLEQLEGAQRPLPALRVKRIGLLRQTGRYHEAVALARDSTARDPGNFWVWFERFFCEMLVGPDAAIEECLASMPASAGHESGIRQRCRGLYAESHMRFDEALGYYADAAALAPDDPSPQNDLARVNFLTMDVDRAMKHLRQAGALEAHNNKLRGRPLNVSQTHYGQILDEYRMDEAVARELAVLWRLQPRERLARLRELVAQAPDNTAVAVSLLLSLRQCGQLRGALAGEPAIPRVIYQFWDSEDVPPDIERLMRSWQSENPGWQIRRFNDQSAQALLAQSLPPPVLNAFRRAREPAQRADLFRLAVLALNGGVYADSDDRCLRPLEAFLPVGASLVLYQEDLGTVGNNLIAVAPRHPVLLRALEQAVTAINQGDADIVWLATGPALLSRVLAGLLARGETMPPGLLVFDRRDAFQAIGMHCAAGYKRTDRHWLESSFRKSTVRRAGQLIP